MSPHEHELIVERVKELEVEILADQVTDALDGLRDWMMLQTNAGRVDLREAVHRALRALSQALGVQGIDALFDGMEPDYCHVLAAMVEFHARYLESSVVAEAEAIVGRC